MLRKTNELNNYVLDRDRWINQLEENTKELKSKADPNSDQQSCLAYTIEAISSHLKNNDQHPIQIILSEFKLRFLFNNRHLLFVECKNPQNQSEFIQPLLINSGSGIIGKQLPIDELKKEVSRCLKEIKQLMAILYQALVGFYELGKKLHNRICQEQLENFCTSLVLDDVVYIFMFNLITLSQLD